MANTTSSRYYARSEPSVPDVQVTDTASLQNWVNSVSTILQSIAGSVRGADRMVRLSEVSDLIDGSSSTDSEAVATSAYAGSQTGDTPSKPEDFGLEVTLFGANVTWAYPAGAKSTISHVEIWVAEGEDADLADAVRVGIVTYPVAQYHHVVTDVYADHTYWIRSVSYGGKFSGMVPDEDSVLVHIIYGADTVSERCADVLKELTGDLSKNELFQTLSETITQDVADDMDSMYTLRVADYDEDDNVVIAGIGLHADGESGQSQIMMYADSFMIVDPSLEGPIVPFIYKNVDGESVIGINGELVVNGTISANAIKTDDVFVGHILRSEHYIPGIAGYQIDGSTGQAEFNGITFRITDLKSSAGWTELPASGADVTDYASSLIANTTAADDATTKANAAAKTATNWQYTGTTEIDGGNIRADTIKALQIDARTITALQIDAGTITANEIAGGTITADEIEAGTITTDRIMANNITTIAGGESAGCSITIAATATEAGKVIIMGTGTMGEAEVASYLYMDGVLLTSEGVTQWTTIYLASTRSITKGSHTFRMYIADALVHHTEISVIITYK